MTLYQTAAHVVVGSPSLRLKSARMWALTASLIPSASLEGYRYCMALLPQVVWLGTSVTDRHAAISRDVQDLVAAAAFTAISLQQYSLALEWLEQGRSIVWGQLLQLRTPLDELSDCYPRLTEELQQVSCQLEAASMLSLANEPSVVSGGLLRDTSIRHRHLLLG
ncbi:hypothetical protein FRC09_020264, partial [Ceratobasidium sp. 395]